ncbi:MAG TPA: DUF1178 family protein [Saliniramus sp.]|nr:DUF1178 family protein [Saliniramus sp.]
MIRYALACDRGHEFESWFPSSAAYDEQVNRALVECPVCGSTSVEKQLMRPSIARSDKGRTVVSSEQFSVLPEASPGGSQGVVQEVSPPPVALLSEREHQLRAMLREIREHVTKNAEDVGSRFVDEARKMHYGETEHRSIYGEATIAEAKELIEEGVEVQALPIIADERN